MCGTILLGATFFEQHLAGLDEHEPGMKQGAGWPPGR
jgi:hypothetical protein